MCYNQSNKVVMYRICCLSLQEKVGIDNPDPEAVLEGEVHSKGYGTTDTPNDKKKPVSYSKCSKIYNKLIMISIS